MSGETVVMELGNPWFCWASVNEVLVETSMGAFTRALTSLFRSLTLNLVSVMDGMVFPSESYVEVLTLSASEWNRYLEVGPLKRS